MGQNCICHRRSAPMLVKFAIWLEETYEKSAMDMYENSRRRTVGFLWVHHIKNDVAAGPRLVRDGLVRIAFEAGEKRCGHSWEFQEAL